MVAEPRMLPSELLRTLSSMEAEERRKADITCDFPVESYHLARAAVLREAMGVVQAHYFDGPVRPPSDEAAATVEPGELSHPTLDRAGPPHYFDGSGGAE